MKWSWTLGQIAGIKLRMHWTFLLLLAWVGLSYAASGGWMSAVNGIAFVLAVFVCVVLHECGHTLTAARFGVPAERPVSRLSRRRALWTLDTQLSARNCHFASLLQIVTHHSEEAA